MDHRTDHGIPFARHSCGSRGLQVTTFGLGGAPLGRGEADQEHDESGAKTVETAYELGLRHIDTSPGYGHSEQRIGIALGRNEFPDLTISTKVGTHPSRKLSYTREDIRWSLMNSLNVLSRDSVDVALIHDPPSIEPVIRDGHGFYALRELREEGLCRNVGLGVHDHGLHRRSIGEGLVDVILTYGDFNIIRRTGTELMRYAKRHGVGVFLGSPMMHGLLATGEAPSAIVERRPRLLSWYTPRDITVAQDWFEWCRERQVSLRHLNAQFVMSSDLPDCVLTGAQTPGEIRTNVFEALNPVPDAVWAEALERIRMFDEQEAPQ